MPPRRILRGGFFNQRLKLQPQKSISVDIFYIPFISRDVIILYDK